MTNLCKTNQWIRDINKIKKKQSKKQENKRKLEPLSARIIKEIGCNTDPVGDDVVHREPHKIF